ncbi:MAG: hypothetical protein U1E39_04710 [Planctomycetota bacterium]
MSNDPTAGAAPSPSTPDVPKTMVGTAVRVLGAAAAVGAFGLWVWFVVANFGRLWERVSHFGPGPGRASKLEVAWALLGWAMGPVFTIAAFAAVAYGFDSLVARWRGRGRPKGGD